MGQDRAGRGEEDKHNEQVNEDTRTRAGGRNKKMRNCGRRTSKSKTRMTRKARGGREGTIVEEGGEEEEQDEGGLERRMRCGEEDELLTAGAGEPGGSRRPPVMSIPP